MRSRALGTPQRLGACNNEDGLALSPILIPIIGWILVLLIYFVSTTLDKNRRPLHDRIAGTTVIRQDREAGRASG